jgi:tRNA(Ile)-lysidine synthase
MRLVALFSGGRDSTCLLHRHAADVVCALHVNYGLRGEESEADEAHCRAVCERLGIELVVHRAGAPAGNVQAWARDVRYAVADELALDRDALVAVGHTATDQAETVLYRLISSPGRRALLGMPRRSGRVVRPLLELTRAETAAYCLAHGLEWREDTANATSARGVLRAALALHPAAERNVLATLARLRDEAEVLDAAVDAARAMAADLTLTQAGGHSPPGGIDLGQLPPALARLVLQRLADEAVGQILAGGDRVALARLRELPVALARLVVVRLAEDAAGVLVPRAASRTEEILALDPGRRWTALDVGDGVLAVVEEGALRMEAA